MWLSVFQSAVAAMPNERREAWPLAEQERARQEEEEEGIFGDRFCLFVQGIVSLVMHQFACFLIFMATTWWPFTLPVGHGLLMLGIVLQVAVIAWLIHGSSCTEPPGFPGGPCSKLQMFRFTGFVLGHIMLMVVIAVVFWAQEVTAPDAYRVIVCALAAIDVGIAFLAMCCCDLYNGLTSDQPMVRFHHPVVPPTSISASPTQVSSQQQPLSFSNGLGQAFHIDCPEAPPPAATAPTVAPVA